MKELKPLFLFSLFILHFSFSCAQSWLWANQGTTYTQCDLSAVAADTKGNVCIAAPYFDSITFGSYHLFTTFGITGGSSFVAKFDTLGNVLWVTQPKVHNGYPNTFCYAFSNSVDNNDNIYITGEDAGLATFGTDSVTTGLGGTGYIPYLVKYAPNGTVLWTRQAKNNGETNNSGIGFGVTTDKLGNAYITGSFEDTLTFGSIHVEDTIPGNNNVFIGKYDANGNVRWVRQATILSSEGGATGYAVGTDQLGNVYVTGYFSGKVTFGTTTLTSINNVNVRDVFLVKYDPNGNVLWARQGNPASATCNSVGYSMVTDSANNVYLAGYIHDTVSFGSSTLINHYGIAAPIYGDIFLAKYDPNGNLIWIKQSTHTSNNSAWSGYVLTIDMFNNIYMTAGAINKSSGNVIFLKDTFSYMATDPDPAFIMKLDTSGNILCSSFSISGGDDQSVLATDPTGRYAYWGGDVETAIVLGKELIDPNYVGEYAFIARWESCDIHSIPPLPTPSGSKEPCNYIFVPDVFSPNGDGHNDVLYVRSSCIASMDFLVFDRWGNKVFESQNINKGWDGTYNGKPMNVATFVWSLKATLLDGTGIDKKGNVTLMR